METVTDAPWWMQVLLALAGAFGTALMAQLGRLMNKWFDELSERTNMAFLANVAEFIMGYVTKVHQEEVKALKESSVDGKLTPEEKKRLAQIPVDAAKKHFKLSKLVGAFGKDDVDEGLASRVEKAVVATKAALGK